MKIVGAKMSHSKFAGLTWDQIISTGYLLILKFEQFWDTSHEKQWKIEKPRKLGYVTGQLGRKLNWPLNCLTLLTPHSLVLSRHPDSILDAFMSSIRSRCYSAQRHQLFTIKWSSELHFLPCTSYKSAVSLTPLLLCGEWKHEDWMNQNWQICTFWSSKFMSQLVQWFHYAMMIFIGNSRASETISEISNRLSRFDCVSITSH